ncbi:hypothetical protein D7D52_35825 [Nocardia yunnanensis]|uniref:Uncharacterized protein n=1 Tax=Nocardia yunnanensis TaxID=2382165 RepID=A0A386ZNN9_9NOCA|nr:hypothetical protein [Nocardia yunnanensis]AYF78309.1 hypothetical protein D7D52_35825 [Nocardia yunnanensis]
MATLGYHALTDEWLVVPWECSYPGRLTEAEARNVLAAHRKHSRHDCRIGRTARRVLKAAARNARQIPTTK